MKYKRVLIFVTILFFFTVLIFSSSMLFSVNEIEVKSTTISNSKEDIVNKADEVLTQFKGKNYLFISTKKVSEEVQKSSSYTQVVSVKKSFPNKLIVEIKERKEALALYYNSKYYVLDENFTILKIDDKNANNIDGLKNVELILNVADYGQAELQVGSVLNVYDNTAFNYMKSSVPNFIENRQNLESVNVEVKRDGIVYNRMNLKMREGVVFKILKANEETNNKLKKAFEFYSSLTMPNGNKAEGEYFVYKLELSGEIIVSNN